MVFVFTAPFARLGGQIHIFLLLMPNSLAMHCQDLVLNQHHPPLDRTCHLTHPGGGGLWLARGISQ